MSDHPSAFRIEALDSGAGGAQRYRILVPRGCPYLRGHFPGHPVLPAIAQLELLDELLRRLHPAARLVGIETLRLEQPVGPGQVLDAELELSGPGSLRFELRCGGRPASRGSVRWSRAPE